MSFAPHRLASARLAPYGRPLAFPPRGRGARAGPPAVCVGRDFRASCENPYVSSNHMGELPLDARRERRPVSVAALSLLHLPPLCWSPSRTGPGTQLSGTHSCASWQVAAVFSPPPLTFDFLRNLIIRTAAVVGLCSLCVCGAGGLGLTPQRAASRLRPSRGLSACADGWSALTSGGRSLSGCSLVGGRNLIGPPPLLALRSAATPLSAASCVRLAGCAALLVRFLAFTCSAARLASRSTP